MIMGIDLGQRRIGIALADDETRWARPLETIDATRVDPLARVAELVNEHDVRTIVVGKATTLRGTPGPAAVVQEEFVEQLKAAVEVPVEEFDERFTTVIAEQGLRAGGARRSTRKDLRDAIAAQLILQGYLDAQR